MNYSTKKKTKSKAKKKHCWTYNSQKIRTCISSVLMFNFCEVLAVRAMVTDAGGVNICRRKVKAP